MPIPRIIYQQISDKKNLHPVFLENASKIRDMNEGWSYHLFDKDDRYDFLGKHFGSDILRLYERINPRLGVVQADFFKYLLMYKTGGLYLDIKSSTTKKLNDILFADDRYILSHWRAPFVGWGTHRELDKFGPEGEYQQWYILAEPGHPYLEAVIETVCRNIYNYNSVRDGFGKIAILRMTGPIAYTLAIKRALKTGNHRLVENIEELGFKYSFLATPDNLLAHQSYFKNHYNNEKNMIPIVIPLPFGGSEKTSFGEGRICRNETCPCGSGKRYKRCHGAFT
jgi:mannosyltransferase OCH1-like enzyme